MKEIQSRKLLKKFLANNDFRKEIIIIDDFSSDGTIEILKKKLLGKVDQVLFNEKNYGKGYSLRRGIEKSNGDIILVQDADLEYDPQDYKKLVEPIRLNEADVVYGSRFIGSDKKRVLYFWHSVGNYFLTLLSNMLSNLNLTDMEVCYKVFKANIIKNIELKENRFGFEPEITAKLAKLDLKIFEVGIKYYGRKYSDGKKITWKDGFSAIRCIIYYNLFN